MGYPVAGAAGGYGCSPIGGVGVGGIGIGIGVILVLYILLIIVLRAGCF